MKQKMSTKKRITLVLVCVLIAVLALGGTYAWTDYSQSALNTFKNNVEADVVLHDDFDGKNKDVYVENTGKNEVYVRVKFAEYLQIGNDSILNAYGETTDKADRTNVATWPIHQFQDAAKEDNKCNLSSHTYFTWYMTGNQKPYLAGVTESDPNGKGGLSQEDFDNLPLGEVTIDDITTEKRNTLEQSDIMLLSTWLELSEDEKPEKACWLLDTDGWAYWSAALEPNTATNLLLDSVEATEEAPYDNWQYNIDVQMQAATVNELDNWYLDGEDEAIANPDNSIATTTANGKQFIEYMMNRESTN